MTHKDKAGLPLSRRTFVNGIGLSIGGALFAPSPDTLASSVDPGYPPALTGMRGSQPGSFEAAHALVSGEQWRFRDSQEQYDLAVVGAGISGLAAAYVYRRDINPHARILILDNHDDFGGHARRNEMVVDGRTVLGFGGSMMMVEPTYYPEAVQDVIRELGIDVQRTSEFYNRSVFTKNGLTRGYFLDKEHYGRDYLAADRDGFGASLDGAPLSRETRQELQRLFADKVDYLHGKSRDERKHIVDTHSWHSYLQQYAGLGTQSLAFLHKWSHGVWAIGADALPAWVALLDGYPGFAGMDAGYELWDSADSSYTAADFYFPDGNASIARLLVNKLIPKVADANGMTDVVNATFQYAALDRQDQSVRLRLNSTVVGVRHVDEALQGPLHVEYVKGSEGWRVTAKQAIWAGYHAMLPHVCDDIPEAQKAALSSSVRAPFVYVTVAIRRWQSIAEAGVHRVYCPGSFYQTVMLTHPVSMGNHQYATSTDQPMVLHLQHVPLEPGLPPAAQFRAGRQRLLTTPLSEFEQNAKNQLARMFSAKGFDADRDIAGITVNRWAHGYAFSADPESGAVNWWPGMHADEQTPWITARSRVGNLAIAGSDAASNAMAEAAIEEAIRAVHSLREP
ncbi:MAG: FAD/NAD(P)-binding protein [Pseudomonadota bacterium]